MSGEVWFGIYVAVGLFIAYRAERAMTLPEERHWSDWMIVLCPPVVLMWPLMLEGDLFRKTPERWKHMREARFERAILTPMEARRVEAWTPVEREILGIADLERWIEKTDRILHQEEVAQMPPVVQEIERLNQDMIRAFSITADRIYM